MLITGHNHGVWHADRHDCLPHGLSNGRHDHWADCAPRHVFFDHYERRAQQRAIRRQAVINRPIFAKRRWFRRLAQKPSRRRAKRRTQRRYPDFSGNPDPVAFPHKTNFDVVVLEGRRPHNGHQSVSVKEGSPGDGTEITGHVFPFKIS